MQQSTLSCILTMTRISSKSGELAHDMAQSRVFIHMNGDAGLDEAHF
jgi:hypothetical protein